MREGFGKNLTEDLTGIIRSGRTAGNTLGTVQSMKTLIEEGTKTGFGQDTMLIRTYMGIDYDVLLNTKGMLVFNGEQFDTPNKLYNNGVVKFVKGKKGNSGTNNLSQFKIKETGERLVDTVIE